MSDPTTATHTHLTWREMERPPSPPPPPKSNLRIPVALCAIFLGALGVHKFVLGYRRAGISMLLVTVLTLGFGGVVVGLIGLIEGILYLVKSDDEFARVYVDSRRTWF